MHVPQNRRSIAHSRAVRLAKHRAVFVVCKVTYRKIRRAKMVYNRRFARCLSSAARFASSGYTQRIIPVGISGTLPKITRPFS